MRLYISPLKLTKKKKKKTFEDSNGVSTLVWLEGGPSGLSGDQFDHTL